MAAEMPLARQQALVDRSHSMKAMLMTRGDVTYSWAPSYAGYSGSAVVLLAKEGSRLERRRETRCFSTTTAPTSDMASSS
jgi:hypothetical protein